MRGALACSLLSLVSACRLEAELVDVPAMGARSALVAAVRAGGEITVDAVDLPQPDDVRFPATSSFVALYVLGYGCPLDALELHEGRVPSGGARPLRSPAFAQRMEADGVWVDQPVPVPALAGARLPGEAPSRCVDLESDDVALPDTNEDSPEAAVALGGERVLVTTSSGRTFHVEGTSVSEVGLSTSGPHVGLFRDDAGEILAITTVGQTVRGTLEGGFRPGPSLTTRGPLDETWLDGGGAEVFVLTPDGSFEHLEGDRFVRLDPGDLGPIRRGGVAWLGPGEALATGLGGGAYSYYARGSYRRLQAELATADDFDAVARLPGIGVVAGTHQGYLFRWSDGRWEPLQPGAISPQMRVIGAIEGRLFFGGSGGSMWQLALDSGELCGPRSYAAAGVRFVASFDGGAFLVSRDRAGSQPTIVTRVRARAGDACGPRER